MTTPLLNKLTPEGRGKGSAETEGVVTARPGAAAGILLTSAQRRRRRTFPSSQTGTEGAETSSTDKQPNKEIVIIVFVPGLFLRWPVPFLVTT